MMLTFAPVVSQLINLFINKKIELISMKLNLRFQENFYTYVMSMDYETLENPDMQVKKDRANNALTGVLNVINQLSTLILATVRMIAISSIVATLNPCIIILIICIIFINSFFARRTNEKRHCLEQELSRYDRFQGAYTYMLEYFCFAKEIRLFRIQSLLVNLLSRSKTESNKVELKYRLSSQKLSMVQTVTNFVQQMVLYAYLVYCVLIKNLAIGNMTIYLSAAGQFSGALSKVFEAYVGLVDRGQKTTPLHTMSY